mmetsp:Transcript_30791/g.73150  ORF Transcript_30791/g.73150 Transcript_30791/m.73150 type:complete len:261 (-) Transcript_30791:970-1752(-)
MLLPGLILLRLDGLGGLDGRAPVEGPRRRLVLVGPEDVHGHARHADGREQRELDLVVLRELEEEERRRHGRAEQRGQHRGRTHHSEGRLGVCRDANHRKQFLEPRAERRSEEQRRRQDPTLDARSQARRRERHLQHAQPPQVQHTVLVCRRLCHQPVERLVPKEEHLGEVGGEEAGEARADPRPDVHGNLVHELSARDLARIELPEEPLERNEGGGDPGSQHPERNIRRETRRRVQHSDSIHVELLDVAEERAGDDRGHG